MATDKQLNKGWWNKKEMPNIVLSLEILVIALEVLLIFLRH